MKWIRIELTDDDMTKLHALATAKAMSAHDAIVDMIRKSQPGGSGWQHPEQAAQPKRALTPVPKPLIDTGLLK